MSLGVSPEEHDRLSSVIDRNSQCGTSSGELTGTSYERQMECIRIYKETESMYQVRKRLHMGPKTIRAILDKHGVVR